MGWPVVRFRDVIDGFDGGKSMKADGDETGNARYYVLKLSAVTSGVFRSDEIKPAPDDYEPNPRHVIHNGDLLITRSNTAALVGASCLVADAPKNLLMPDLIWRVKVKQKSSVLPTFLLATLQHPQVRQRISALATGTSDSMRKLSQARLATLSVMIPPLSIQRTFDESASTLMRLRTRHEALALKEASMLASLQAGLLG
jgi:type I restriction enzyme S subunit